MNELALKNLVNINILFANMREISGVVLGSMFVQILGDEAHIREALSFLQSRGVKVERSRL